MIHSRIIRSVKLGRENRDIPIDSGINIIQITRDNRCITTQKLIVA